MVSEVEWKEALAQAITTLWHGLPKQGQTDFEGTVSAWGLALLAPDAYGDSVHATPQEMQLAAVALTRKLEWFPGVGRFIREIYAVRHILEDEYERRELVWAEKENGRWGQVHASQVKAIEARPFTPQELADAKARFYKSAEKLIGKIGDDGQ